MTEEAFTVEVLVFDGFDELDAVGRSRCSSRRGPT
jgi:hypothetical protein